MTSPLMRNGDEFLEGKGFLRMLPRKQLITTVSYGIFRILTATVWPLFLYRHLKGTALPDTSILIVGLVGLLLLFVCGGVASYRQSMINIRLLNGFSFQLSQRIWRKMNALDWLVFHSKSRVYHFDMMMVEAWRLRGGMGAILDVLIVNSIIAGALILLIAFVSMPLFLACLGALALLGGLHTYAMYQQRPYIQRFHAAWRTQHQWVAKSVDQFDLIKMGRGYLQSAGEQGEQTAGFLHANAEKLRQQTRWRIIGQFASNVMRVAIFLLGIFWLHQGVVQLSELLVVLLFVSIVQSNLMQLPGAASQFMEGQDAARTLATFFGLKEESVEQSTDFDNQPIRQVTFNGMRYRYDDQEATCAPGLDLTLNRGNIYLWQGENGSGKSTAAHVLMGLLEPQAGTLTINGDGLDWKVLKALRPRFGFLNQDSPLFMGSVKENAVFGHQAPDEVWAKLDESWLSQLLPLGSGIGARSVGERGEGLSGGEAKRIALIRELLRPYDVLILDEPLNHLDGYAISLLKAELIHLKVNAIIVIISHQPGFEAIADEIISFS